MRITSKGVLDFLEYNDKMRLLEKERQDAKEATAISLISKYGLLGDQDFTLASTTGTKSGKSKSANISYNNTLVRLQKDFDLTNEILAPIMASGDKTAVPRLYEILKTQKDKYEADNRVFPKELAKDIIENAAIELPSMREVNFDVYEEYIGREMDSLYKQIFTEQFGSKPGSVAFENVTYAEPVDINEIPKVLATAAKSHASLAQSELGILIKRQNELQDISNRTAEQQNEFIALTERVSDVKSAIENLEENPSQIINLYGNSYIKKLLESPGGEKYKTVPLPPLLTDAANQYPLVASEELGKALVNAGVLSEGTVARLPTGELIELVRGQ